MKDRIKKLMESQHMTQQVFADFLGMAPATLSGIFNDRTRPTLNVVEAIKKKFPDISTDWLMFGKEPMYVADTTATTTQEAAPARSSNGAANGSPVGMSVRETMLDFGQSSSPTPQNVRQPSPNYNGVRSTHPEYVREEIKYIDKPQRRVTEIRVYYDDQTWESFVPSKK
jgi:transcriptional regulator with XRE-family HTH domain